MSALLIICCTILSFGCSVLSVEERSHNHGPSWIDHCWEMGYEHVKDPFCAQLVACPDPTDIANGAYSKPTLTTSGFQTTYSCNEGYHMIGQPIVMCASSVTKSVWGTPPNCVPMCPEPIAIEHATVVAERTTGSIANYTCDSGYTNFDGITSVCLSNGTWSVPLPACTPVCPEPVATEHGTVVAGNTVGSVANYTCNSGYANFDGFSSICLSNGSWSLPVPVCSPVCPAVPTIEKGSFQAPDNTRVGTQVNYVCDEGYQFVAENLIQCLATGKWSSPLPVCIPIDCDPIPTIDNGHTVGQPLSSLYNSTIVYECDENYEIVDTDRTTCLINGYWSLLPECIRTGCGPFPVVANATIVDSDNDTFVGSRAQYECDSGYELMNNDTVECLPTGAWSELPVCEPVCDRAPEITNAYMVGPRSNSNGAQVQYNCTRGYELLSIATIICQNGTWSELPVCIPGCMDSDIVFLVDGSGSVGSFGFLDTLNFVNAMVDRYPISRTHFGLVTFSSNVDLVFKLNEYINNKAGLKQAISNTNYPTGNTDTGGALKFARTDMFTQSNGMRPGVLQIAIVVTDGQSENTTATIGQAQLLKDAGVTIYSVGVGNQIAMNELQGIASQGNYVFNVENYSNITQVTGPLAEATCRTIEVR